jgi:hypothetical protein
VAPWMQRHLSVRTVCVGLLIACGIGWGAEAWGARASQDKVYAVIPAAVASDFLAYAARQHPRDAALVKGASVGDILPPSGITYYAIPLTYGFPFDRFASVGGHIMIVDRGSREVVQVFD